MPHSLLGSGRCQLSTKPKTISSVFPTSAGRPHHWHAIHPPVPSARALQPRPAAAAAAAQSKHSAETPAALQPATRPRMRLVLVAAVALLNAERQVLLAQRPSGKDMAGLWEFPGGKVEEGETPEAALVRELQEELGIQVEEASLRPLTFASHTYSKSNGKSFHLLMPVYACSNWEGELVGVEGQELAWVGVEQLNAYEMPPADIPLLPAIKAAMRGLLA